MGWQRVRLYRGEHLPPMPDGFSLVVIMGGPMGVYEQERYPFLAEELRFLERAWHRGVATLGICLGAQLMARAVGCRVYKGDCKEIGWYQIELTDAGRREPLLRGLPEEPVVFHWHGDTFELPQGAELLASSKLYENQMVRMAKNWYAIQFHLELTEAMILEWLNIEENIEEMLKAGIDREKVLYNTPRYIEGLKCYGRTFFRRFLRGLKGSLHKEA